MLINAKGLEYTQLNDLVRNTKDDCLITDCLGQRFIGAGSSEKTINIKGVPGNALGAYLNGSNIVVEGNAQDATGDTMNDGTIVIHGNIGDAAGYAMRGGTIFVKGNAGYRAGIHMKAYKTKVPALIIGGKAGSFLGEYQAGGIIMVLGLKDDSKEIVGEFPCTGMHGGKMIIRGDISKIEFPGHVNLREPNAEDMAEIEKYVKEFCTYFEKDFSVVMKEKFTVIVPDTNNIYKQMYVAN